MSEPHSLRASAQITLAAPAHPRHPSRANVIVTEARGETFKGSSARTVMSRKSHGSERNRSVDAITADSSQPPRKPAAPPITAASTLASRAAAGASSNETRVP
jgi:hypothetical protein